MTENSRRDTHVPYTPWLMLQTEVVAATPRVRLEGVHRTFRIGSSEVYALRGIDLTVESGEFVALWGPSGSGKSTLLNIMGLVDCPDKGSVHIAGHDVSRWSDDQRSDYRNVHIGFIFQNFNLIPVLSSVENVMLPLQMRGVSTPVARKRALEVMNEVKLRDFADRNVERLSGGQRQRVAVARALVTAPSFIVADEPTANLDSVTSGELIHLMQDLNQRARVTFILATHDSRLLAQIPRCLAMQDGRLVQNPQDFGTDIQGRVGV